MPDSYQSMRLRLWNWGRWGRQNPDAPDGSCRNHLYDMMIERAEGWGDVGIDALAFHPYPATGRTPPG